jgi:uncharacterized membrane protein
MRGNRDLAIASGAAIACGLLAILVPWEGLRLLAALPLVFVLPGYAIAAAAFGLRRLEPTQSIMLSLGCSLAVLCLGALVLNYLPGGIQTVSWATLLALVVVACCGVALYRREGEQADEVLPAPRRSRPRWVDVLCGVVAVALVAGAVGLANTPLPAGNAQGYTSLWMLPAGAAGHAVRLGVSSSEQGTRRYVLKLQVDEGQMKVISRFALRPGDEHVFTVPIVASQHRPALVGGLLFRQSDPVTPLRKVRTWLPPAGH